VSKGGLILIADDNPDDLILLERAFNKAGVLNPIHQVRSGRDTIAYLNGDGEFADRTRHPFPRILLLDLHMPHGDGFAVLEWIRNKSLGKDLLIVILSRLDEMKNINRAYSLGANSFLAKPGDPAELNELIRSFHDYWLLKNRSPSFES
jgi:CheY-like chemotaxis protein